MASCVVHNKSPEPLPLPYPMAGVLRPGQLIVLPFSASLVRSYMFSIPQGYEIFTPDSEPLSYPDIAYAGALASPASTNAPAAGSGTSTSPEIGDLFVVRVAFTAGVTGTADDVTILSSAPVRLRIIQIYQMVSVSSASFGYVRNAPNAGGQAISGPLSSSSVGRVTDTGTTLFPVIEKGGGVYLRRQDRAYAGEIALICERIN